MKSIQSDVSIHEYRIRKIYFLLLCPFSLFLFPYWGDECLSLYNGFDIIVLLIATIIQSDRMHILANIVWNLYNQMYQFTNIEKGKIRFLFLFPCSFFFIPFALLGRSMYVIRYWFWYIYITYNNNNTKWQDAYIGKNSLKFIQSDVSIHEYRIRKNYVFFSLFLFPYSFFLIGAINVCH